jgi:flagellar M-ring protein FliF
MDITISGVAQQLGSAFKKLSKTAKILIFSSIGAVIAVAIILAVVLNSGNYTVLYRGLSSAESLEILQLLDDMAVDVKVGKDGSILVPAEKEAELKMKLASEGYPNSTLSYDLFLGQADLLTTDFEQRKLYTFQLQDRLQKSIETLQGVKGAIVTLGIPEENSYVLKDERVDISASVTLQLYSNATLTPKQINGIVSLVAKSIPGLLPENVVIIGEDGEQLNGGTGYDSTALSSKIETVNKLNKLFEDKIKSFLKPVFGKDGMSIAVNVIVDFNRTMSEETSYTPVIGENGVISWVEQSSEKIGGTSQTDEEIPTYLEAEEDQSGSSSSSSSSYSAQYLVNQLIKQIQNDGGNIKDMTVAVIVDAPQMSDEEIAKYKELVAYSAGISVEKVALTYSKFIKDNSGYKPPVDDEKTGWMLPFELGTTEIIIISASGALLITLIVTLLLAARHRKKKKQRRQQEEKEKSQREQAEQEMPGEIILNETREQALKRQIKEFASENAETVAQLLRVWIKEDESR